MRCTAFYDCNLLMKDVSFVGEGLSVWGKLWPIDEPCCDLTHVRHQSIRVSVTVTLCADHSTC